MRFMILCSSFFEIELVPLGGPDLHDASPRTPTWIQCDRETRFSSAFQAREGSVTGFTDDRSRYRVVSGVYLHKSRKESIDALRNAIKKGRVPRQVYLDNGKQFIAKEFKAELARYHIKPIYGEPYHPKGRGKIERYHKVLWQELITQVRFSSLSHFKRELGKFDRRYNYWRKNQALGWKTPASIYNDPRFFGKGSLKGF